MKSDGPTKYETNFFWKKNEFDWIECDPLNMGEMNFTALPTTVTTPALRAAWRQFLTTTGATHALTLTLNEPSNPNAIGSKLHRFFGLLDNKLLGTRYHLAPLSRRTFYTAFAENVDSNAHVHALLRVVPDRHATIERVLSGTRQTIWTKVAPCGTHVIRPIIDDGWANYSTKFLYPDSEFFVSA